MEFYFKIRLLTFITLFIAQGSGYFNHLHAEDTQHQDSLKKEVEISEDLFSLLLNVNENPDTAEKDALQQDLNKFVAKLARKQKRYRSEERFVKYLFYKIHNRYLKNYSQHTDFYELLNEGSYDCITGTAFYALILDALQIDYVIRELPYHVYLMVEVDDTPQMLLLESTDAMAGFVRQPEEIKQRIAVYHQELEKSSDSYYRYEFAINEDINLTKLAALNYYNEAIVHYNAQNLEDASELLAEARRLYPGKRMEALQNLIEQVARQQIASRDR